MVQVACAQTVPLPNPEFESGAGAPAGWTLSGGQGEWLAAGGEVRGRALAVAGDGNDSNYWRSTPLPLQPEALYQLRYRARNLGGAGGTATCGPVFANEDIGSGTEVWSTYTQFFRTPRGLTAEQAWLRFGQWHLNGRIAFAEPALLGAAPLHRRTGDLRLGNGESVDGLTYRFDAPLNSVSNNDARPLVWHTAGFNSNRWVFGAGSEVVYRHEIGQRTLRQAKVAVDVGWYAGGQLAVEASADGQRWTPLATLGELGSVEAEVPAPLVPARSLWIRLRAEAKQRIGTESDPGSFQVHGYQFEAALDGQPADARGATHYIAVPRAHPQLQVEFGSLGEGIPGARNELELTLRNPGPAVTVRPRLGLARPGEAPAWHDEDGVLLPVGETALRLPYEVPGTGAWDLHFELPGEQPYEAVASLQVAELYNAAFGWTLPASSDQTALWWCESGWKISRERPAPRAASPAVRIRAARNEAEAAQVVIRPSQPLRGLTAQPTALKGPGGKTISADRVDILKVRYVPVTQPTDKVGTAAPWPDPLPPLKAPLDLAANLNQPLWVRVNVPAGAAAGEYTGTVQLQAEGWQAAVPVALTVYDFDIPTRATLTTAFGLSAGLINRYQGLTTEAQRREVWRKYLASYSAHHISPYDPAPYDPIRVTWTGSGSWQGGERDSTEKRTGQSSLKLADESVTSGRSAAFDQPLEIPAGGLVLQFDYRAEAGHEFIVTFNHSDSGGQWMSGRNNDMRLRGTGQWEHHQRVVTTFPDGAKSLRLSLWPCLYSEEGTTTGTVWFDNVRVSEAATGKVVLHEGFEPVAPDAIRAQIDWTAWDRAMATALDEYGFNSFRMPIQGLGGGTFHARTEPSLMGFAEDTPQYQAAMADYLKQLEEHLQAKGWLDESYVYWFDEPDPKDYEFVLNGFKKLARWAPGIPRMLTEQPEPALFGGPNIWCPVSSSYDSGSAKPRMDVGEKFWWYVCTGPKEPYATLFIDHPGTELRVWCWQTWQRGIEGILVWQSNYWTSDTAYPDRDQPQNPYLDPMGWVSGYDTPAGTKRGWGNGDGRFVYPPEAAADGNPAAPVLDGPVDSIRFEMLRDGIEDYEYLAILRRLLSAQANRLSETDHARYQRLLDVPEALTATATEFTTDPGVIEARRAEVAQAIAALRGR